MSKYISVTETAKLIRASLKENFKGIKFSVRSSSYAGGASISVTWIDGPCEPDVARIVKAFEGASFDSMTDSTSYHTSELNGEKVHFGSDYVMTQRRLSSTFVEAIVKQFCAYHGIPMLRISGSENDAWVDTNKLDYSTEHWLSDLLRNTDAKNMHRAYQAEEESKARQQTEYEAEMKAQTEKEAKARAEAQAKAEQERKAKEQAEFARFQREVLQNEAWQKEQFKKWQVEQARLAREEAERKEAQRKAEEQAKRERQRREQEERERRQREQQERERMNIQKRSILATKASALAFLGLPINADRNVILTAFRAKVKASADGKGGYTGDMDLLVKAKEKALS